MATAATTEAPISADYEIVIGLEVHSQLLTASKMFCRCPANYANAAPNTHCCPICMGFPGMMPVINRKAVEYTIMTALALNCEIPDFSKFDRKNYFYPDLPKGYQISQYDIPLSRNGYVTFTHDGREKRVGVTRVHLEEDTGRLLHVNEGGDPHTLVDLNRSGVPLMEIVSEPDMRSPEEARLYMEKLRSILIYLGVSSGKMEEAALRCDANISVRPRGQAALGVKTEIKNMNSFRAVERALTYEATRQVAELRAGRRIVQATRGWVDERGVTVLQRVKENSDDYRYFPEPDLPPLVVSRAWVDEIRARMPELPDAKRARFVADYGLSAYDAEQLTAERALADYFESALKIGQPYADSPAMQARAKAVANWTLGDLRALLNADARDITASPITPQGIADLLTLVERGSISGKQAKDALAKAYASGEQPATIIEREGVSQISDTSELDGIVAEVIAANPKPVEDYRAGKTSALQFLVGQVMKRTRGRAKPDAVMPIIERQLGGGA